MMQETARKNRQTCQPVVRRQQQQHHHQLHHQLHHRHHHQHQQSHTKQTNTINKTLLVYAHINNNSSSSSSQHKTMPTSAAVASHSLPLGASEFPTNFLFQFCCVCRGCRSSRKEDVKRFKTGKDFQELLKMAKNLFFFKNFVFV